MSLFLATVLVGALMAFVGVCFLFKENVMSDFCQKFPRSQNAAILTMGIGGSWFLWKVLHLEIADFGEHKHLIFVFFALVGVFSFKYVPDFLSIRGLAIIALLSSRVLLDAAYLQDPQSRLFLVTIVYVFIGCALYFGAVPFRVRDCVNWLFEKRPRIKWLGMTSSVYGALLLLVAFSY